MHLEKIKVHQAGRFDRYFIGFLLILFVFFVAQLPHLAAVIAKVGFDQLGQLDTVGILQALPSNTTLVLMLFPFAVVMWLILVLVRRLHGLSPILFITSRSSIDWKRVRFGFLSVAVVTLFMFCLGLMVAPDDFQWNFDPKSFVLLFVIAIFLIPLQTTAEEFFFRGYLMQGLGQLFPSRLFPFLITSLVFGMMHYGNPEVDKLGSLVMVSYISSGLFLGMITLMDEGLELAIGYHAGNNLLVALLLTSDWTAFQTNSLFLDVSSPNVYVYAFLPLPFFVLLLYIYSKKYGWNNWRQRLIGSPKA